MLAGCLSGKARFVGTYIGDRNGAVLELNSDGTFSFESQGSGFISGSVTTGEWDVVKEDGSVAVVFTPLILQSAIGSLVKSKRGKDLIEPVFGETFVKQ